MATFLGEPSWWDDDSRLTVVGKLWRDMNPKALTGEVSMRSARQNFLTDFYSGLAQGSLAQVVDRVAGDYREVYVVLNTLTGARDAQERTLIEAHQREQIGRRHETLGQFKETLRNMPLQASLKDQYSHRIIDETRLLASVQLLSRAAITPKQMLADDWLRLIDPVLSANVGMVMLPWEQLAMDVLERYKQTKRVTLPMSQAVKRLQLSSRELAWLGLQPDQKRLTEKQGARLFRIFLERLRLDETWRVVVDQTAHSIMVAAAGRTIHLPLGRRLTPADMVSIPFHEMVHVVGGVNGGLQTNPLFGEGIPGYLETEEGIATVAEALGGMPFGNLRQAIIAGRYMAVAMALKAVRTDKAIVPLYTIQDIYERLRYYQLPHREAAKIVWRVCRGTTLRHQGMELGLPSIQGYMELPIAECFARDSVYFRGFVKMLQWMRGETGDRMDLGMTVGQLDRAYTDLTLMPKKELARRIARLRLGKLPLELMIGDEGAAERIIENVEGWVDYAQVLEPVF